jgi:flagellar basal-body rod protein FlgG
MAIAALNSAATGLRALSTRIDVTANNLANAETNSFKRSRTNFEDLMYVTVRQPGALNAAQEVTPAGLQIGLGVKVSNTSIDLEQGPLENTGNPLDVSIEGSGFFRIATPEGAGDGFGYTRNGYLFVNADGELVIGNQDGYRLDPPITIPPDVPDNGISISPAGIVEVKRNGQVVAEQVGQVQIFRFVNPRGLLNSGGNVMTETAASGPATQSNPGTDGAGTVRQGFLEASNVDPVKELVGLIKTQRSFELNSQSIQTADQALQVIANLRRG